uniref:Fibronectin type-III domain-containing protein n=1 Tax=Salarias fasciatus TaxID=181472 RepID=A0A672F853_SALFA
MKPRLRRAERRSSEQPRPLRTEVPGTSPLPARLPARLPAPGPLRDCPPRSSAGSLRVKRAAGGGEAAAAGASPSGLVAEEAVAATTKPDIYYCRSPNMEDFTCWWHPLDNLTAGEEATYVLTYSKEKGRVQECPDYVSAGPNSCHFDSSHTSIWKIYCLNVTAVTSRGNYTSRQHCLDVADIVQTEAPVNLTYQLTAAGGDEAGQSVLLSWKYPVPSHLQYGWITLEYELQYSRVTEPDNWKVKHPLREPHFQLLGLPFGEYAVRVRCRSRNHGLWSKWSSTLSMSIPAKPPAGKLLLLILATGVSVVVLLVITFGVIPQSSRIKEYFLPPIPKPRIIGVDPLLLKKGNLDQINHHFSNFHGYRPPSYSEEVWDHASVDHVYLTTPTGGGGGVPSEQDTLMVAVTSDLQLTAQSSAPCAQTTSPYCASPPAASAPPPGVLSEIVTLPGSDYSVAVPASDPAAGRSPQDFYTCVQLMNESGEVHLVPCLPPAYCQEFAPFDKPDADGARKKKKKKEEEETQKRLAEYQTGKGAQKDGEYSERGEAAVPLLPVSFDYVS